MLNILWFIRSTSGRIAFVVMAVLFFVTVKFLSRDVGTQLADSAAALRSGSLSLEIMKAEQSYDGVDIQAKVTNNTDREIVSAMGTLVAKDSLNNRLMHDEHPIVDPLSGGLAPRGAKQEHFFLYDLRLDDIKHYSFRASFVQFTES